MIDRTNIEYVVIVCLYAKNKLMEAALTLRFGEPLSIIENNRSWIVTLDEAKALWYEADQEQIELSKDGLPLNELVPQRKCLRCKKDFTPDDKVNYTCKSCKKSKYSKKGTRFIAETLEINK
mgnify:FL=1